MGQSPKVMEIASVPQAIAWQATHMEEAGSPGGARLVRALLPLLDGATMVGQRMRDWPGLTLEDAMPLRVAGGLHNLLLTGDEPELAQVYAGQITDQAAIDRLVDAIVRRHDARLLPWLDGPPQTNEAGRSASVMAALLWLSARLGPRFQLIEIGASAGINTMMDRYFYDLGGTTAGPAASPVRIVPEWRGDAPPQVPVEIVGVKGCDIAPIDLTDPAQALRLKAYIWPEHTVRFERMEAAIKAAGERKPDLVKMNAADFIEAELARAQESGTTRMLMHSIVWQYVPDDQQERVRAAMEAAGAGAAAEKPLAWVSVEADRTVHRHMLKVRYWPGGEEEVQLAWSHPHGADVEWIAG
ncbi:MAG: DUF2332 domain-containing protein [Erythrobacter sp.]|nr:DUF2332 domain-containing protein [Erythrobacter sp.]